MKKTPTHISIFESLHISLAHRAILEKSLCESLVSRDIDENIFQDIVGILVVAPCVAFTERDIPTERLSHNDPLHLEVFMHKNKIKRVLIDGGASLNICTLNFVKALGYLELHIDPNKKINIKSYDDEECPSKGVATLLVQVGPITTKTKFQVLDKELGYNMLL